MIRSLHLNAALALALSLLAQLPSAPARAEEKVEEKAAGKKIHEVSCDLSPLFSIPAVWEITPDTLEAQFPKLEGFGDNPYFTWVTADRSRAVFMSRPYANLRVHLSLLGGTLPIQEVTVDFVDGRLNGVAFSVYSRGDGGKAASFAELGKLCDAALRERMGVTPSPRKPDPTRGVLSQGYAWISPQGLATLEHNPEALNGKVEYLRMRIAPRTATGAIADSLRGRAASAKLSELQSHVRRGESGSLGKAGDVWIAGIPMVDQGDKGYCVVASSQRLLEYFGVSCDQHQVAQYAKSDAESGTSLTEMSKALEQLQSKFRMDFEWIAAMYSDDLLRRVRSQREFEPEDFQKEVIRAADKGIPLLWALKVGDFPEIPPLKEQDSGYHMRLVIGYNLEEAQILFSDTWGAGHELKRMRMSDAYAATLGVFSMRPTVY